MSLSPYKFVGTLCGILLGYGLGCYHPLALVAPAPKPWVIPVEALYASKLPEHWKIKSNFGRWRFYVPDGEYDPYSQEAEEVTKLLQKYFEQVTALHDEFDIWLKDDQQWRDYDDLIFKSLSKIPVTPFPTIEQSPPDLRAAIEAWQTALGRKVPVPKIKYGECGWLVIMPVACIDNDDNSIVLVRRNWEDGFVAADRRTVYMHELGHLMGVEHIKGDRLMDAEYGGPVDVPTQAAITAAKHAKIDGVTCRK